MSSGFFTHKCESFKEMSIKIVQCKCPPYKEHRLAEAIFNILCHEIHFKTDKKWYTSDESQQLKDPMNKVKYEIIEKIMDRIITLKINKINFDDNNNFLKLIFGDNSSKLIFGDIVYTPRYEKVADQVCEIIPKHKEL